MDSKFAFSSLLAVGAIGLLRIFLKSTKEISRKPIDYRYTPGCGGIETRYSQKYNSQSGKYESFPESVIARYPEKWEVLYLVTYADGSTKRIWSDATRKEAEATM